MFRWMLVLMIVVPAAEIWMLLEIGRRIGGWQTFLLLLATGFIGALLAKREFRRVAGYARDEWARGAIPASSILDGMCIFAGGLLLLVPGLMTDAVGLVLLVPQTRMLCKAALLRAIRRKIDSRQTAYVYRK